MKKILSTFLFVLFTLPILAQSNGLNPLIYVKVDNLEYVQPKAEQDKDLSLGDVLITVTKTLDGKTPDEHHANMAPSVNAMIKSALGRVYRFRVVDELEQGYDNYSLGGNITRLTTTSQRKVHESKDSKGKTIKKIEMIYDGHVAMQLVLKSLTTGEITNRNFSANYTSSGDLSSPEKALTGAINNLFKYIYDFYDHLFPIRANIIQVEEMTKTKVKKLYIDVGSAIGVAEGERFEIFELNTVAGRTIKNKIGRIKVDEVSGSDISLCKVQRGTKEIKEAIDAKKHLQVILE